MLLMPLMRIGLIWSVSRSVWDQHQNRESRAIIQEIGGSKAVPELLYPFFVWRSAALHPNARSARWGPRRCAPAYRSKVLFRGRTLRPDFARHRSLRPLCPKRSSQALIRVASPVPPILERL